MTADEVNRYLDTVPAIENPVYEDGYIERLADTLNKLAYDEFLAFVRCLVKHAHITEEGKTRLMWLNRALDHVPSFRGALKRVHDEREARAVRGT